MRSAYLICHDNYHSCSIPSRQLEIRYQMLSDGGCSPPYTPTSKCPDDYHNCSRKTWAHETVVGGPQVMLMLGCFEYTLYAYFYHTTLCHYSCNSIVALCCRNIDHESHELNHDLPAVRRPASRISEYQQQSIFNCGSLRLHILYAHLGDSP